MTDIVASGWITITTNGTGTSASGGGAYDNITITWPNITYPSDGTVPQPTYEEIVPEYPDYPVFPGIVFEDPEKEELKERLRRVESLLDEMMDLLESKGAL